MSNSLQIFTWGVPLYMLMYSALHIMQWFSHILDVFTPKMRRKFFDLNIFMNQNKHCLHKTWTDRQNNVVHYIVQFITGVKLICYFVLYYYFLHWAHPQNITVGDLDFYYTLYLWVEGMVSHISCIWIWTLNALILIRIVIRMVSLEHLSYF